MVSVVDAAMLKVTGSQSMRILVPRTRAHVQLGGVEIVAAVAPIKLLVIDTLTPTEAFGPALLTGTRKLATLPEDGPTGGYFHLGDPLPW